MRVTIKDVARQAGVSDTAVSLAFRENSRISTRTRQRILRAARDLNYAPNTAARNLRAGRTGTIGFLVNDITNPFYALMLKEAELALEAHGYEIFSVGSDWSLEREVKIVQRMAQSRVEGVLMCLCEKGCDALDILDLHRVPHIALDSFPDFYTGAYVANDLYTCGALVARHFAGTGRRTPGFINADASMAGFSAFRKILQGYTDTLAQLGIALEDDNVAAAGLTIESGRAAFADAQSRGCAADAYFCVNDLCALGFMDAALQAGVNVGTDIAVVGVDNLEVSALSRISLTSVRQPYAEIARHAAEALLEMIGSDTDLPRLELAPELIVRRSSTGVD